MQFIYQVLRAAPLDRQFNFYSCYKSVAFRLRGKTSKKLGSWKSHLSFLFRMFLLLWSIPFRLRRRKQAKVILYNVGKSAAQRIYYYKKHSKNDVDEEGILALHHDRATEALYFAKFGPKEFARLSFAAWIIAKSTLFSAWGRSRVNPHWKIRFANMLLQQVLFFNEETDQLLFFCYEPETYLSSLVASGIIPEYAPKVVSSNSLLFVNNRYLFNPKLDLKICSRIQVVETAAYRKKGWMNVASLQLWGLEEALKFDELPITKPVYDIGIYSSGGWARTHNLWRSYDLELLKKGGYPENPLYLKTKMILDAVCDLKQSQPLKVKFYLHPHELGLLKTHGIRAPFLDQLDENGIAYSLETADSIDEIYEAQIGLGVSSTILFDRMHLGLKSFFDDGKDMPDGIVDVRFLGEYAKYAFSDAEELKVKLREELAQS